MAFSIGGIYVNVVQNLVDKSKYNIKCPYAMNPSRIVVHNTANDASARNEVAYMIGNDNQVSFHYAVDDLEVVQGIPESRNAWHASDGNGKGNREGIAIEICYSKSGGKRFDSAEKNAAKLIAQILDRYGWSIEKVTKHQDYASKYCPHRTLDKGWDRFIKMIELERQKMISFEKFIEKYTGKSVANPQVGTYKGQCVSLVQMYLYECFGYKFEARGNGNLYAGNLIKKGLATKVSVANIKKGDIISYPAGHSGCDLNYGHVAIYYDKNHVFQQNVNYAGDGVDTMTASLNHGFKPKLDSTCTIARMKKAPVADTKKTIDQLADEVMDGKWGNDPERSKKLTAAGYDAEAVQDRVNEKYYGNKTTTLKKGDKVKVKKGAKDYNGVQLASFVYSNTYTVLEAPNGNRVVIGKNGKVTCAIHKNNLIKQ